MPIHDKLVQMGLLEFWEKKQQSGHQRLFEDVPLANDGTYSSTFSKWVSRYLTNLGIKTDKTSFHSLLHNVKDFFRQVGESGISGLTCSNSRPVLIFWALAEGAVN